MKGLGGIETGAAQSRAQALGPWCRHASRRLWPDCRADQRPSAFSSIRGFPWQPKWLQGKHRNQLRRQEQVPDSTLRPRCGQSRGPCRKKKKPDTLSKRGVRPQKLGGQM